MLAALVALAMLTPVTFLQWQRAERSREKAEQEMAIGLLRPITNSRNALTAVEIYTLWELAEQSNENVRMKFLEIALGSKKAAQAVGRRADYVALAAVGLSTVRRNAFLDIIHKRFNESADIDIKVACIHVALALCDDDHAFSAEAVPAICQALHDTRFANDRPWLLDSLGVVVLNLKDPEFSRFLNEVFESGFVAVSKDAQQTDLSTGILYSIARRMSKDQASSLADRILADDIWKKRKPEDLAEENGFSRIGNLLDMLLAALPRLDDNKRTEVADTVVSWHFGNHLSSLFFIRADCKPLLNALSTTTANELGRQLDVKISNVKDEWDWMEIAETFRGIAKQMTDADRDELASKMFDRSVAALTSGDWVSADSAARVAAQHSDNGKAIERILESLAAASASDDGEQSKVFIDLVSEVAGFIDSPRGLAVAKTLTPLLASPDNDVAQKADFALARLFQRLDQKDATSLALHLASYARDAEGKTRERVVTHFLRVYERAQPVDLFESQPALSGVFLTPTGMLKPVRDSDGDVKIDGSTLEQDALTPDQAITALEIIRDFAEATADRQKGLAAEYVCSKAFQRLVAQKTDDGTIIHNGPHDAAFRLRGYAMVTNLGPFEASELGELAVNEMARVEDITVDEKMLESFDKLVARGMSLEFAKWLVREIATARQQRIRKILLDSIDNCHKLELGELNELASETLDLIQNDPAKSPQGRIYLTIAFNRIIRKLADDRKDALGRKLAPTLLADIQTAEPTEPFAVALEEFPPVITEEELVDLLKSPMCIDRVKLVVLDKLKKELDAHVDFAHVWEFISYCERNDYEFDFTGPPRRFRGSPVQ